MKTKTIIGILICSLLLFILGFQKLSDAKEAYDTPTGFNSDTVYINISGHKVALWQQEENLYAFLPSACKDAGIKPKIPAIIDSSSIIQVYSENIPAVFIETESGTSEQINSDKDIREPGKISVLDADGHTVTFPLDYIKGRGNTSYTEFEKKSYQIKLRESAPFLGMQSSKKWIFTANAADSSLLRNALSRDLADHLGLPQSKEGVFVDLYLNGEYAGNYYVTEKVEVAKTRLNITNLEKEMEILNNDVNLSLYDTAWTEKTKAKQIPIEPEDITGGYLIERDFDARFIKEVETNGSYFITQAEECFILRSPEYASENQVAYINDFVQSVENAILSPDGIDARSGKYYTDLIDVKSFVRKYLLEEVTANYDGGVASSYFYKDIDTVSDKLYAGPVWDYDVTWGNSPAYLGYLSTSPNRLTKLASHTDSSVWFCALYDKPDFYKEITACYQNEISSYLQTLAEKTLPRLAETTNASAAMDRLRWQSQYTKNEVTRSREEEIAFLSDYIMQRKSFLDKAWIEQIPLHQITLMVEDTVYDTLYVFDGEPLPVLPAIDSEYVPFICWRTEDDALPDIGTPMYTDIVFHADLQY
ncbi:MAG: CotH kinase family protein [Bacillus sp. (in: Bacteria)]|nr:CotH kinase family protein [Bacillus sp. (in: firmicutes)]MCM1426602.1 CotH kinase family protein [Eubacterium sp.]